MSTNFTSKQQLNLQMNLSTGEASTPRMDRHRGTQSISELQGREIAGV